MPFTGNEGTQITRVQAKGMIEKFQQSGQYKNIKGGFFGRKILLAILNQPNCVGIRYYHSLDAKSQPTLVLVGEDQNGTILSDGILGEEGPLCPPWCGVANPLDQ